MSSSRKRQKESSLNESKKKCLKTKSPVRAHDVHISSPIKCLSASGTVKLRTAYSALDKTCHVVATVKEGEGKIKYKVEDETLCIWNTGGLSSGSGSVIINNGSTIRIGGNSNMSFTGRGVFINGQPLAEYQAEQKRDNENSVPEDREREFVFTAGTLRRILSSGASTVNLDGQQCIEQNASKEIRFRSSGSSKIHSRVQIARADVKTSGTSQITLSGTMKKLHVNLSGTSSIRGNSGSAVDDLHVSASGCASVATFLVNEECDVSASGCARISVQALRGATVDKSTSGMASCNVQRI